MASFIEFPIFTGVSGDLRPCISWLEAFFVREKFTAMEKMNLAQSLLEGKAESWFYSIQKMMIFYDWEELKDNLLLRFGDFADPDRIRLIDEHDRFFKDLRDEARIQRRKTTSIPAKDSIWKTETDALVPTDTIPVTNLTESREPTDSTLATKLFQEAISESVMDGGVSFENEISCQAVEYIHTIESFSAKESIEKDESSSAKDESITQTQVPVSSLEPGLSFSSEILDVSVAWPSEMVSINRVHSQAGFECVKNKNNAHHVLDEMPLRRHKFQQRKKPSLSPKSRMFKFKNRTLLSNCSQKDLHQVIDISIVNNLSPCFSANFGLVRQKKTIQCLRLTKQAHKSRVLYHMRMLHDPGGMKQLLRHNVTMISAKLQETIRGWDEAYDAEIIAWEGTGTWIVTSLPANKTGYASRKGDWPENAVLHLLKMLLELFLFIHLEDKVCLSGASNSWYGWLVFDRGKNHIITGDVITLVLLDNVEVGSKGLAYDGCVIFGMNGAGGGRWKADLLATGQQIHTPFQMIYSVGTFVLLAQRVFQKLAAQLSKHFEILIKRIQPALYQLNCFIGSLWDSPITCSKFGHTTNMQLIVVYMLYSWGICIGVTNSWKIKFCKDWWFKFKYNIRIGEAFDYGTI